IALRAAAGEPVTAALPRDVLARSLYGVDLNPAAVRLTELRLWLALVADDPTADVAAITPLPNLDGHVRQGDALLDPYTAASTLAGDAHWSAARAELARAATARHALFALTGARKRDAARELASAEALLARRLIDRGVDRIEARIDELLAAAKSPDLFGRRPGLAAGAQHRLRAPPGSRRGIRRARPRAHRARRRVRVARAGQTGDERVRRAPAPPLVVGHATRARRVLGRLGANLRRGRLPDGARR